MASEYDEQDIDKNKDILLLDDIFHKVKTKETSHLSQRQKVCAKKFVTMGMITF